MNVAIPKLWPDKQDGLLFCILLPEIWGGKRLKEMTMMKPDI